MSSFLRSRVRSRAIPRKDLNLSVAEPQADQGINCSERIMSRRETVGMERSAKSIASLRWYYPDQVQRVRSMPGLRSQPLRLP